VGRLLREAGFSLQANAKTLEGQQHPDRGAQFRYLNEQVKGHQAAGEPVISVDTKQKQQLGRLPTHRNQHNRRVNSLRLPGGAQRFLSAFSGISPHFRPRRHQLSADAYRRKMTTRFATWNDVVGLPTAS
jgi:hypothetical protein